MTEEQLVREAVAFAIEFSDTCHIEDGYAIKNGWPDEDWLSDWGAFLADSVLREIYSRGYIIARRAGAGRERPGNMIASFGAISHTADGNQG